MAKVQPAIRDEDGAEPSGAAAPAQVGSAWCTTRPSAQDLLRCRWWWVRWPGRVELLDATSLGQLALQPSMEFAPAVPPPPLIDRPPRP